VIHPKKHYDVIAFPSLLESEAFECIVALRAVLVVLYD
jgi:hypothetical protein